MFCAIISDDFFYSFKPVDIRFVVGPFREEFELAFCSTFSRKQNIKFLSHIQVSVLLYNDVIVFWWSINFKIDMILQYIRLISDTFWYAWPIVGTPP